MRDAAAIEPVFYDHEQDGRRSRERRADDWGADAVFAPHPRRRFSRRPDDAPGRPVHRQDVAHDHRLEDRRSLARAEARAKLPEAGDLTEGLEWGAPAPAPTAVAAVGPVEALPPAGGDLPSVAAPEPPSLPPASQPAGRRTVVITGRPEGRRRPPRRPEERLGSRPDRVAAWAVGMGIVLIAVASAPV